MNTLLQIAVSNLVVAAALAVPAALASWWGRRPAVTHGLWLLVLLKLVTPPLWSMPIATLEAPPAEPIVPILLAERAPQPDLANLPPVEPDAPPPMVPVDEPEAPPPVRDEVAIILPPAPPQPPAAVAPAPPVEEASTLAWTQVLTALWLAGALAWLQLAAWRLNRFQRLLRFARPAPAELQAEARELAHAMGVRCPQVLLLPGAVSPMLWAIGRAPRLLLPEELLARLRPAQRATLLAHELAHWRRGDHRVRWLEVAALGLYWWCPFVWWACRQLHQAEEECCDAWVVAVLPDAARDYALALVETIDFLSGAPQALPPVASGVGHVRLLQRRLTMILRGSTPQSLTRAGLITLAGIALALLPFVPSLAQQPAPQPAPPVAGDAERLARELEAVLQKHVGGIDKQVQKALELQLFELGAVQVPQAQADLDKRRAELELQLKQLHDAIRHLKDAAKAAAAQQSTLPRTAPPMGPVGPMGGGGTTKPMGPQGPGMGSMMPPATKGGGSVEQRLEQVERKLDTLLWEITNLRREMTKGHMGSGSSSGTRSSSGSSWGSGPNPPGSGFGPPPGAGPGAPPLGMQGGGGSTSGSTSGGFRFGGFGGGSGFGTGTTTGGSGGFGGGTFPGGGFGGKGLPGGGANPPQDK